MLVTVWRRHWHIHVSKANYVDMLVWHLDSKIALRQSCTLKLSAVITVVSSISKKIPHQSNPVVRAVMPFFVSSACLYIEFLPWRKSNLASRHEKGNFTLLQFFSTLWQGENKCIQITVASVTFSDCDNVNTVTTTVYRRWDLLVIDWSVKTEEFLDFLERSLSLTLWLPRRFQIWAELKEDMGT